MMSGDNSQPLFFKPSCPSGGKFYACETGTNFVGCCTREPCNSVGCTDGSLKPASFDPDFYGKFPDQQCPSGSRWYTCGFTDPPFMGCCKSNPCAKPKGCPAGDLTAGFLDSNPRVAAPFLSPSGTRATSTISSISPSSSAPSSSTEAASSSTEAASSSTEATSSSTSAASSSTVVAASSKISPGAIAGGVVGGVAVIALLILIGIFICFRRRKTATAAPVELMRSEKDDKVGQPEQVAHPYHHGEIHEAPGDDVIARDVKNSSHPGSAYPSPSPAYSPGQYGSTRSPPGYPPVTELDSPGTPFLRHHESHQSFELPLSVGRGNDVRGLQSGVSSEGLGINFTALSHGSTISTTTHGHPSPSATMTDPNGSPHERGARWNYHE